MLLATAVPAASASENIELKITQFSAWYTWTDGLRTGLTGNLNIQTPGDDGTSLSGVTVTIITSAEGLSGETTVDTNASSPGWAAAEGFGSTDMTFVYTLESDLESNGSANLQFNLAGNDNLHDADQKELTAIAASVTPQRSDTRQAEAARMGSAGDPFPPLANP